MKFEPRKRRLAAAKGVDTAHRKALQAFERLLLPREVAVFHPDGEDARFRAVCKVMKVDVPARVAKAGDDGVFFRRLFFDFQKRALAVAHGDAQRIVDERLVARKGNLDEAVQRDFFLLSNGEERKPHRRLAFMPFDGHFLIAHGNIAEKIFLIKHSPSKNTGQYAVPPRKTYFLKAWSSRSDRTT